MHKLLYFNSERFLKLITTSLHVILILSILSWNWQGVLTCTQAPSVGYSVFVNINFGGI